MSERRRPTLGERFQDMTLMPMVIGAEAVLFASLGTIAGGVAGNLLHVTNTVDVFGTSINAAWATGAAIAEVAGFGLPPTIKSLYKRRQ